MESSCIVSFYDVCKYYREELILNNCNFTINKNELVTIMGSSGSGKTTLIELLLGVEQPSSGKIVYNSKEHDYEKLIGFVSQDNLFYEDLTVNENLTYYAKLHRVNKDLIESRIKELLRIIHLQNFESLQVKKLSGGMKRRLELALSLINDPKILILDEPFAGLDIKLKLEIWEFIKRINKMDLTIIISTHLIDLVKNDCDKFLVLNNNTLKSIDPSRYEMKELVNFY